MWCPYHRFVKTTPKPSATKKSSGELVGPPLPFDLDVCVAEGTADVVLVDMLAVVVCCCAQYSAEAQRELRESGCSGLMMRLTLLTSRGGMGWEVSRPVRSFSFAFAVRLVIVNVEGHAQRWYLSVRLRAALCVPCGGSQCSAGVR